LEVAARLTDGVGGALKPVTAVRGLLGGEDLDEALGELVQPVGQADVTIERRRVELRQDEDSPELGVQATADRNIDETVLAADRHSRLGSGMRQRKQSSAAPTPEDDRQDVTHGGSIANCGLRTADCPLRATRDGGGLGLSPQI